MRRNITLRKINPSDEPFLYRVYASTREEELAPLGWDRQQVAQFLRMQFEAQHSYYQDQFADADFLIVLLDDQAIGRLYIAKREGEFRLIDIALLPAHRGAGIGTNLLKDLLAEALWKQKPVRIHVERSNRAMRFYHRLGFVEIGEGEVYSLMEWSAELRSDIR